MSVIGLKYLVDAKKQKKKKIADIQLGKRRGYGIQNCIKVSEF